jgi:hypothetical protein
MTYTTQNLTMQNLVAAVMLAILLVMTVFPQVGYTESPLRMAFRRATTLTIVMVPFLAIFLASVGTYHLFNEFMDKGIKLLIYTEPSLTYTNAFIAATSTLFVLMMVIFLVIRQFSRMAQEAGYGAPSSLLVYVAVTGTVVTLNHIALLSLPRSV